MPDAGPHRGPGPQAGPLALFAPPARLALTTDSALGPQRSGQAHCARLVAPSRFRPEDRPPARRVDALQQSGTLCPSGSAQQIPAGGPPPARRVDASQLSCTLCPPGSDQQILPGGSPPASERSSSRRSRTLCPPESDLQNRAGGPLPAGGRSGLQRSSTRCPTGSNLAESAARRVLGHTVPVWKRPDRSGQRGAPPRLASDRALAGLAPLRPPCGAHAACVKEECHQAQLPRSGRAPVAVAKHEVEGVVVVLGPLLREVVCPYLLPSPPG